MVNIKCPKGLKNVFLVDDEILNIYLVLLKEVLQISQISKIMEALITWHESHNLSSSFHSL